MDGVILYNYSGIVILFDEIVLMEQYSPFSGGIAECYTQTDKE